MTNAAIVYLLRSTKSDVNDIIKSLKSLYTYFLVTYKYPVYIFIESSFKDEYKNIILEETKIDVIFHLITFKIPPHLQNYGDISNILETHNGRQLWPIGYRHMCRFWSGDFLNNEIIKQYKYIWRMDSDAYISINISEDLFNTMEVSNISYYYSNIGYDDEEVCKNLSKYSNEFFNNKTIAYIWQLYTMYTTHVEIINIEEFTNGLYYEYYKFIDKYPGFYLHRWGDAPIRYIAVTNLNISCCKLPIMYEHENDGSGRKEQILNNDFAK